MPDNKFLTLATESDWLELYNGGDQPVSLDGCYLTDDLAVPQALSLAGKTLLAQGRLVILLDDSAPFRLSAEGETVYLTCNGQVLSQLTQIQVFIPLA